MMNANGSKRPNPAVCVYCGSQAGSNPVYAEAARTLGTALAGDGFDLVYGGGGVGLMGEVARSVLNAGGHVTGIIPGFLKDREVHLGDVQELIVTQDMHQRKMLMYERAAAFVALPGGIGTLEELIEQFTWAQLGQHRKPIVLANVAGFWNPLATLLQHMHAQSFLQQSFVPGSRDAAYLVVDRAEDIVGELKRLLQRDGTLSPPAEITNRF